VKEVKVEAEDQHQEMKDLGGDELQKVKDEEDYLR
jgi:hypothetical protein